MSTPVEYTVRSADGTVIAAERLGDGPALILVDGANCHRASYGQRPLAALLADRFTVHVYDRRGMGGSGDTAPWAVEREIDDLAAVVAAAGGSASAYGHSSGGALVLRAAAAGLPIERLAVYETSFALTAAQHAAQNAALRAIEDALANADLSCAARLFLQLVGLPRVVRTIMRVLPVWKELTAAAPTLPYNLRLLGADGDAPIRLDWAVTVPVLAVAGSKSPDAALIAPTRAVADAVPGARFALLDGQTHMVAPAALAPLLSRFFAGDRASTA